MRSKVTNGVSEREDPFPPMVNREMLCSLVRRSFRQTEEQQMLFEQTLRQEYSRRTKGEVSVSLTKNLCSQIFRYTGKSYPN